MKKIGEFGKHDFDFEWDEFAEEFPGYFGYRKRIDWDPCYF